MNKLYENVEVAGCYC